MKKIKTTLILLNILFGCLIYYSASNNELEIGTSQNKITDLSKVHKIEILNNKDAISVYKNNHNWEIISPLKWDADEYSISNFQTIFSHLKFSEIFDFDEIAERGEIIDDYGITSESPKIILYSNSNKTIIKLGKPTRDQKNIYCLIQNTNVEKAKIWRVSEEISSLIKTPLKEWADTNLVRCGLYQIDDITASFKSKNNSTTTTKLIKKQREWYFEEPFKAKANDDQVRFLINNILSEQIIEFTDGNEYNSSLLDIDKDWVLKFEINSSGSKQVFKVSETYENNSNPFRICKSSYSNHLLKIDDNFLANFSNWSTKLRERNILQINIKNLLKLKIINKHDNFEIIKTGLNNWSIKPEFGKIIDGDYENISSLIRELNGIEIKEFLSFNPTQNELKLIHNYENTYLIKVYNVDTSINTVLISRNKLNASLWKTLRIEDSLLCLVDESLNNVLDLKIYQLKDRKVFKNKLIRDITIYDLDSNLTTEKALKKSSDALVDYFNNLSVHSFLDNQGKDDGTWNDGDWVPWRYDLKFNLEHNSTNNYKFSMLLSDILTSNQLIGKFTEDNVTFNLPIDFIRQLDTLKKEISEIKN